MKIRLRRFLAAFVICSLIPAITYAKNICIDSSVVESLKNQIKNIHSSLESVQVEAKPKKSLRAIDKESDLYSLCFAKFSPIVAEIKNLPVPTSPILEKKYHYLNDFIFTQLKTTIVRIKNNIDNESDLNIKRELIDEGNKKCSQMFDNAQKLLKEIKKSGSKSKKVTWDPEIKKQ